MTDKRPEEQRWPDGSTGPITLRFCPEHGLTNYSSCRYAVGCDKTLVAVQVQPVADQAEPVSDKNRGKPTESGQAERCGEDNAFGGMAPDWCHLPAGHSGPHCWEGERCEVCGGSGQAEPEPAERDSVLICPACKESLTGTIDQLEEDHECFELGIDPVWYVPAEQAEGRIAEPGEVTVSLSREGAEKIERMLAVAWEDDLARVFRAALSTEGEPDG